MKTVSRTAPVSPGACRAYGDRDEKVGNRGRFPAEFEDNSELPDENSRETWANLPPSKPIHPKSDRLLEVKNVVVRFGGIVALDGIGFTLPRGAILGLIGPNGAGKTTLFNCLSRLYTPDSGDIRFEGQSILDAAPHAMASLGIGRTFQNLALFESMSVRHNIMVGAHARSRGGFLSGVLRPPSVRAEEARLMDRARDLMDYLDLAGVAHLPVADLPFGTRKRVELGRALASEPRLLLLDEPAGGLNHDEVFEFADLIGRIRDERRISVLLVEHHMRLVMTISDKVVVIDFGRKIGEGTPRDIQKNPEVIRAYLGKGDESTSDGSMTGFDYE